MDRATLFYCPGVWGWMCVWVSVLDQWEKKEDGRRQKESDTRDQKQRKEEGDMRGRQDRRWEVLRMALHDMLAMNLQQPPVGQRPRSTVHKEDAEWGFSCECFQQVWKKNSSWNNVLTTGLFIRLFIDVCWHWRAPSTVEPQLLLSTLFDFIPQSLSQQWQVFCRATHCACSE